jgi:pimeloyl-ACP methyl ester carboxylesterase
MHRCGAAGLRAAVAGKAEKEAYEASDPEFDPALFTEADRVALAGPWSWFDSVVGPAIAHGRGGLVDDDLAYVTPWGFDCAQLSRPLLLLHGGEDRIVPKEHGAWLARHCPTAELWLLPQEGHISVLSGAARALDWLRAQAASVAGTR